MFDNLVWLPDRLRIGDAVLAVESLGTDHRDESEFLVIHKNRQIVERYQRFFQAFPQFQPSSILELGLWDGGSLVFWNELLHPAKIVGVDLADRTDKPYFRSYVQSHGLEDRVVAFWHTDQADRNRLRELVRSEFQGGLDLVIDDCSHIYGPTKASFEALFPLLIPGGWYIVEDWDWGHKPPPVVRNIPWSHERSLTDLIVEIVKLVGSLPEAFPRVLMQPGLIAVQRGHLDLHGEDDLIIEDHIIEKALPYAIAASAGEGMPPGGPDMKERVSALESKLEQTSALLGEIHGSRAWKMIESLRRVRIQLAPPGGLRERLLLSLLDRRRR